MFTERRKALEERELALQKAREEELLREQALAAQQEQDRLQKERDEMKQAMRDEARAEANKLLQEALATQETSMRTVLEQQIRAEYEGKNKPKAPQDEPPTKKAKPNDAMNASSQEAQASNILQAMSCSTLKEYLEPHLEPNVSPSFCHRHPQQAQLSVTKASSIWRQTEVREHTQCQCQCQLLQATCSPVSQKLHAYYSMGAAHRMDDKPAANRSIQLPGTFSLAVPGRH